VSTCLCVIQPDTHSIVNCSFIQLLNLSIGQPLIHLTVIIQPSFIQPSFIQLVNLSTGQLLIYPTRLHSTVIHSIHQSLIQPSFNRLRVQRVINSTRCSSNRQPLTPTGLRVIQRLSIKRLINSTARSSNRHPFNRHSSNRHPFNLPAIHSTPQPFIQSLNLSTGQSLI